jgi:hypothetical protein
VNTEPLASRDPMSGSYVKRDPNEKMTRLEFWTELRDCWVYQRDLARKKDWSPLFKEAADTLDAGIKCLEGTYPNDVLCGQFDEDALIQEINNVVPKRTIKDHSDFHPGIAEDHTQGGFIGE